MIEKLYKIFHPRYQTVFLDYKVHQKPRYGHGLRPHKKLLNIIKKDDEAYAKYLRKLLDYQSDIWSLSSKLASYNFSWRNGYLPGLDIVGLYGFIRLLQPKTYIEIGSGHSTKVAHQARVDENIAVKITSIDPHPRDDIDLLADNIIRQPMEEVDLSVFDALEDGDILFVDNSHRILPNSDSMVFFLDVLPSLASGVVIQMHDIYLPEDYPQFMCDRSYSEQYGLAIALISNPDKYKILLPNYYISNHKELAGLISPLWQHDDLHNVERHGGSFWFQVR